MPTGYTKDIGKGISFKKYAMTCARAFGALITMRDEPFDAEIPEEFKPSPYHLEQIENTNHQLDQIEAMTSAACNAAARKDYEEAVASHEKGLTKRKQLLRNYELMLAQARRWQPPSPQHQELKKFMIDQIEKSIEFDCGNMDQYYLRNKPVLQTGEEWREARLASLRQDLEYHTEGYQKEVERCKERSEWIQQLRGSLS